MLRTTKGIASYARSAALAVGFYLLTCGAQALTFAADVASRAAPTAGQAKGQYVGFIKCGLCHDRRPQEQGASLAESEPVFTNFVSLTEYRTWFSKDKHAKAFQVLSNDLSARMRNLLGYDVRRDPRCLSCHATLHNGQPPPLVELALGVTCEGCHGPASGWLLSHTDPPWRTLSSGEKQQQGMTDVRDPVIKARLCLSCHVGNASEGKVVSHEMYAAGHPPLPGVEIETHLRKMPAHWISLGDKPESIRSALGYDAKEMYRTKSVVLGGVLALREFLSLIAARSPAKAQDSWPDFALYDCYSCHHDIPELKDQKGQSIASVRQQRGYKGVAGALQFPDWPKALVKMAIFHTTRDGAAYRKKSREFADKLRDVWSAHRARSSGNDGKPVQPSARDKVMSDLIDWLNRLAQDVAASRFDRSSTVRLAQRLAVLQEADDPDSMALPDYSTARQIAWALDSLYKDFKPANEREREIDNMLSRIKSVVDLELPGKRQAVENYHPKVFRDQVARLLELLQP